jgi:hypothetical protein
MGRPETIEETAEMVTARGGTGIWVQVDHTRPEQVKGLFEQVDEEQEGRLDILINDVWGGDPLTEWGKPFWKHSLENGLLMQRRAVHSHPFFGASETPSYIGRAVVALASDPDVIEKTGQPLHVGNLAREYGFTDIDGRQPHCPQDFAEIRKRMRRFQVSDLRDIARELGIEGRSRMSKGELFGAIQWIDAGLLE